MQTNLSSLRFLAKTFESTHSFGPNSKSLEELEGDWDDRAFASDVVNDLYHHDNSKVDGNRQKGSVQVRETEVEGGRPQDGWRQSKATGQWLGEIRHDEGYDWWHGTLTADLTRERPDDKTLLHVVTAHGNDRVATTLVTLQDKGDGTFQATGQEWGPDRIGRKVVRTGLWSELPPPDPEPPAQSQGWFAALIHGGREKGAQ